MSDLIWYNLVGFGGGARHPTMDALLKPPRPPLARATSHYAFRHHHLLFTPSHVTADLSIRIEPSNPL